MAELYKILDTGSYALTLGVEASTNLMIKGKLIYKSKGHKDSSNLENTHTHLIYQGNTEKERKTKREERKGHFRSNIS